jgi:poly(3-hydroxyalkanoate) synthetase
VEALRRNGLSRVFVTDWRSATPDMRYFGIDSYLADLNVVVDELASPVDLIGLCQGGWLSLVYAARFPGKVRRLVLVGAPVDFHAGDSALSRTVGSLPPAVFENLVGLGEGRVLGHHVLDAWAPMLDAAAADRVLQIAPNLGADERHALEARFREWYAWTVNLPGTYYLETIERLYRENEIATGRFVALGRRIDLADVRAPLFLLATTSLLRPNSSSGPRVSSVRRPARSKPPSKPAAISACFSAHARSPAAGGRIARWLAADQPIAVTLRGLEPGRVG